MPAPGVAQAQPQDYSVLIDSDNSDATGCTVGTPPEAFLGADLSERTLYHGHSYGGNALAAAVAIR